MRTLLAGAAFCLTMTVQACGSTQAQAKLPTVADYRQAILVTKDAWVLATDACVDAYIATHDPALLQDCKKVLNPAHDFLVASAMTLDAVGHIDMCALAAIVTQLSGVVVSLGNKANAAAAMAVGEAIQTVSVFVDQCSGDAGGGG